jgi:hypothetical protein
MAPTGVYDEMVGRSSAPLLTGVQSNVEVHDGDVFNYTVLGHTAVVTVTATYDTDGTTVKSISYDGLFDDNHSHFNVTLNSDSTFTANQEIIFRMEAADGNVLVYLYSKSSLDSGTINADGTFDASGHESMITSNSWVYLNIAGLPCDQNHGMLEAEYADYKVKARAGGMSVLRHGSVNIMELYNDPAPWETLTFDKVDLYETWSQTAKDLNQWCYALTNYTVSDSRWHMMSGSGDGSAFQTDFDNFN